MSVVYMTPEAMKDHQCPHYYGIGGKIIAHLEDGFVKVFWSTHCTVLKESELTTKSPRKKRRR